MTKDKLIKHGEKQAEVIFNDTKPGLIDQYIYRRGFAAAVEMMWPVVESVKDMPKNQGTQVYEWVRDLEPALSDLEKKVSEYEKK